MDREQKTIENHLEEVFEESFNMDLGKAIDYVGKNIKGIEKLGYDISSYKGLYFMMFEDYMGDKVLN